MTSPDLHESHRRVLRAAVDVVAATEYRYTLAIKDREMAIQGALAAGMTQAQIAEATGLSKQRVSNLLKGR